jgi:hypothetical protein
MIIVLQLCLFVVVAVLRGRTLFGMHLRPLTPGSDILSFRFKTRFGVHARHIGRAALGTIPFVVQQEKWYHRFLKNFGIASEIDVGHSSFDKRFFITTDFPGHLERLLASPDLRKHLQGLFRFRVKSLHATRHRVWCVISRDNFSKPDKHFHRHFELLGRISEDSRATLAREQTPPAWRWRGVAALCFIAVQAGLLTHGVLAFLPGFIDTAHTADRGILVLTGTIAGLIGASIWLGLIIALFRRSSWIAWVLADFVLCGVLGFLLSGISVVREVNMEGPQAEPVHYEQQVAGKSCVLYCRRGSRRFARRASFSFATAAQCTKESRQAIINAKKNWHSACDSRVWFSYTVTIKHWRGGGTYAFTSDAGTFDGVDVGGRILVPVNPGALGLEWVNWKEMRAVR